MFKGKKVIIFDLDGTLIDSVGVWNDVDRAVIAKYCKKPLEDNIDVGKQRDTWLAKYFYTEDTYKGYCTELKNKYLSDYSVEDIKEARDRTSKEFIETKVDYKDGAVDLLKLLKKKGFVLTIGSTTNDFTIDIYKTKNKNIISKAPLDDYFDLILSKGSVKKFKPDPEVFLKILDRTNCEKQDALIIEDSLIGVEAANNAGVEVVAVYDKYSDSAREEINSKANYKVNSFYELIDILNEELGRD